MQTETIKGEILVSVTPKTSTQCSETSERAKSSSRIARKAGVQRSDLTTQIPKRFLLLAFTHRPQSSSFLGLPYIILNMNPKKELLWGLWVHKSSKTQSVSSLGFPPLNAIQGQIIGKCWNEWGARNPKPEKGRIQRQAHPTKIAGSGLGMKRLVSNFGRSYCEPGQKIETAEDKPIS